MAEVTIGVVVYNGGGTLAAALDSLLAQTFGDFRLILSDNGSTDATADICRDYASRHDRIDHIRRETTLAPRQHFQAVLDEATTPYFMWAPADDLWAPGFLAAHHAFLAAHPEYVASQGRVLLQARGFPSRMAQGTFALRDDARRNVARFLANPADNSRFYGLYRTAALRRAFPSANFYGFDWAVSAATLVSGRHHEVADVLMIRDETPAPFYVETAARYDDSKWVAVVPLLAMTRHLWRSSEIPKSAALAWSLAKLNARLSLRFWSFRLRAAAEHQLERRPRGFLAGFARRYVAWVAPGVSERRVSKQSTAAAADWAGARIGLAGPIATTEFGWLPLTAPQDNAASRHVPDVSVILVVRDQVLDVLAVTQALPRAIGDATCELIVADRGSQDATGLCLAPRGDLTFLPLAVDIDVATAANAAAERARGHCLVFMDAGAILHVGALTRLAAAADCTTIAGPLSLGGDGNIHARGGQLRASPSESLIDTGQRLNARHLVVGEVDFCVRGLAIRRDVFHGLGGFTSDWMTLTGAGADLSARARRSGIRSVIAPQAVVSMRTTGHEFSERERRRDAALSADWHRLLPHPRDRSST